MDESKSQEDKPNEAERQFDPELLKKGLRCDLDHYGRLKRCSDKKDMTEWNEWRKRNADEDILLKGAELSHFHLEGALFTSGGWRDTATAEEVKFKGSVHLEGARLRKAWLDEANFSRAHLENAWLDHAHIRRANLRARLQNAKLRHADLTGADLWRAHLEGADFYGACLQGAQVAMTQVNGETMIARVAIDRFTDFTGVALANACVEPSVKQLLEYNVRWLGWHKWYDNAPSVDWDSERSNWWEPRPPIWARGLKKVFVRTFWSVSDYGFSTRRIIIIFFALAFVFANIYYHWGRLAPPGIVSNLFVGEDGLALPSWLVPLRTLYFSIVTMTTLGFGDMYANARSIWGHILLSL